MSSIMMTCRQIYPEKACVHPENVHFEKKIRKIWKNNAALPVQNHDVQLEMLQYEADQDVGKMSVTWRGLLLHASEWRQ